jgi:hypothetical protein
VDSIGRFYLSKHSDGFNFDYKIYGLETDLINRVIKTYDATSENLGVLLNGVKGTGKTISSKIIAGKLNQPTILVDKAFDDVHNFLNSISQNITIFIDEYEKVFGDSSSMLTIMDGALNSKFRRVFLLTTNNLYVEQNLIQRPSRIRYLKTFENLSPSIVEEILDDILIYKNLKNECIDFISNLELITVDIVKAVINEVNIHNESPSVFQSIFNVKKLKGKYNVSLREEDNSLVEIASSVNCYPRPTYNENNVGNYFTINNVYIGLITRVINFSTIELEPMKDNKGRNKGFDKSVIIKVEDADVINYAYTYGELYEGKSSKIQKTNHEFLGKFDDEETISEIDGEITSPINKTEF